MTRLRCSLGCGRDLRLQSGQVLKIERLGLVIVRWGICEVCNRDVRLGSQVESEGGLTVAAEPFGSRQEWVTCRGSGEQIYRVNVGKPFRPGSRRWFTLSDLSPRDAEALAAEQGA